MASTLHSRIDSAIRTAKAWEADTSLLTEIRASIPMKELVPELVCDLESGWNSFLSLGASDNDDDIANVAATSNTAKNIEENNCGETKTNVKNDASFKNKYYRPDDTNYEGDDLLLKRLTLYFQKEVMKWVNQPPCSNSSCVGNHDGKKMENRSMRGPVTEEEKRGGAGRVEVYSCQLCNTEATFPRYNSPRTLFQTRRGRCGEFANLFGAYCRALGFDTRYISDFTDHVWVEVWSVRQQRWLHADSCEGLIDRPNMYEQGWGKKLNYAIGVTCDSVTDVTKRYTRKFFSDDFQARRREFSPDEVTSDRVIMQADAILKQMSKSPKGRLDELEKRGKIEASFFGIVQSSGVWDTEYREGRISGSLAWKAARSELGEKSSKKLESEESQDNDEEEDVTHSYLVESFRPDSRDKEVVIMVRPPSPSQSATKPHQDCINVSGVSCAATLVPHGISVVVVDEVSGCILQSRAFSEWSTTGAFLGTVPIGRIIALCSNVVGEKDGNADEKTIDESTGKIIQTLGGLNLDAFGTKLSESGSSENNSTKNSLLYVGQIGFHPKWATCIQTSDCSTSITVSLQINALSTKVMLRSEANTVPSVISTRLPESIMPLKTQLVASCYQKRIAFEEYMDKMKNSSSFDSSSVAGYATKPEAPIYLIDNRAFPFRRADGITQKSATSWVTYHFLPNALVPDDDIITEAKENSSSSANKTSTPKFDIPVVDGYFRGLLGDQLLVKSAASSPTLMDTSSALSNTRLVALYFSAQWCGPCRGFTPLLIEFYNFLKEEVAPTHGLEIIFVSSDRDEAQFQQYYQKMPFNALPFSNRIAAQRIKSTYGVQGIPSLVVIDTISGRVVVAQDESRKEVHQACQMGEQAIERLFNSWLEKIPEESKSILDILALSCEEVEKSASVDEEGAGKAKNSKIENYLVRKKQNEDIGDSKPKSKRLSSAEESAARVKEIFSQLVAEGNEPNAAAVKAIEQATTEKKRSLSNEILEEGALCGTSERAPTQFVTNSVKAAAEEMCRLNSGSKSEVCSVLSTAKKYVSNVQKDPSNPRFRTFRLGNKVFDQITSRSGGVNLLTSIGFSIFHSDVDFVASIPLAVDLRLMSDVLDKTLSVYSA